MSVPQGDVMSSDQHDLGVIHSLMSYLTAFLGLFTISQKTGDTMGNFKIFNIFFDSELLTKWGIQKKWILETVPNSTFYSPVRVLRFAFLPENLIQAKFKD